MRLVLGLIVFTALLGCDDDTERAFCASQQAIRPGMSLGEAFGAGLADYMVAMGTRNVPGATLPSAQPVDRDCRRYVLDVAYTGSFSIRVYCDTNAPSSPQLVPARTVETKALLERLLDEEYGAWAASMEFKIESPPRQLFGDYRRYVFSTDRRARVSSISPLDAVCP